MLLFFVQFQFRCDSVILIKSTCSKLFIKLLDNCVVSFSFHKISTKMLQSNNFIYIFPNKVICNLLANAYIVWIEIKIKSIRSIAHWILHPFTYCKLPIFHWTTINLNGKMYESPHQSTNRNIIMFLIHTFIVLLLGSWPLYFFLINKLISKLN